MNQTLPTEALKAAVMSVFPSSVTLNYVAYDDNLNKDQICLVNDVLNLEITYDGFVDSIYDQIDNFLVDGSSEAVRMYKQEIESSMQKCLKDTEYDVGDVMSELDEFILSELSHRDDSTPVHDLIKNTRSQYLRVQMHSNYEGLDSGHALWRDGISYDEYFKHIVDVLNLNPSKLKHVLLKADFKCNGRWPNCKSRDGKEYVNYEKFAVELINTTSNCNTLTFVGKLDVNELNNYQGKVTFPAGNCCGLFDSFNGAGGVIEMELLRPLTIDFNKAQYGESCYDKFAAYIDNTKGYSIDSVYGVTSKFWGEQVSI